MDFAKIFAREIKLTMGCTDPGTVAYAAAKAASLIKGDITAITVALSPNLYKNALYVSIPTLRRPGIEDAALLGALVKRPEMKLEVLSGVDELVLARFKQLKNRVKVSVSHQEFDDPLYLEVTCSNDDERVRVVIRGDYDRIYRIYRNQEIVFEDEAAATCQTQPEKLRFADIYQQVLAADADELRELVKYEELNKQAAYPGLPVHLRNPGENCAAGRLPDDNQAMVRARLYTFYASKMRMSGEPFQIASVAGSGNLGIISMLSVSGVCDCLAVTPEKKIRALALSVLTAIYIKNFMDRTTVMCGTAIAGGAGGAAATSYLLGGDWGCIQRAVNTTLGTLTGMICDGAKASCAFKAGMAAQNGVLSGMMAVQGDYIEPGAGIVTADLDQTVMNIGRINNHCMREVNRTILQIIEGQSTTDRVSGGGL